MSVFKVAKLEEHWLDAVFDYKSVFYNNKTNTDFLEMRLF